MFGIFADLISTGLTVLLPVFLSYKTLQQNPPSALSPWLMYFIVLTLLLQAESFFSFILDFVPFYSWFRLFAHAYLILPGLQGATYIYTAHLEPFLRNHERQIDQFITDAHANAKKAGLDYLQKAIELVRVKVLGMAPAAPPPQPPAAATYTQQLLARFAPPGVAAGLAGAAGGASGAGGDVYSLLTSAVTAAMSRAPASRDAQAEELTRSGALVPDGLRGEERARYVSTQRERLQVLLQAFDREEAGAPGTFGADQMRKSRSEAEFDKIEMDEAGGEGAAGWMPWNWSGKGPIGSGGEHQARSSGVDYSQQ